MDSKRISKTKNKICRNSKYRFSKSRRTSNKITRRSTRNFTRNRKRNRSKNKIFSRNKKSSTNNNKRPNNKWQISKRKFMCVKSSSKRSICCRKWLPRRRNKWHRRLKTSNQANCARNSILWQRIHSKNTCRRKWQLKRQCRKINKMCRRITKTKSRNAKNKNRTWVILKRT